MVNFVDDGTNYVASEDPNEVSRKLSDNYSRIENWIHSTNLLSMEIRHTTWWLLASENKVNGRT